MLASDRRSQTSPSPQSASPRRARRRARPMLPLVAILALGLLAGAMATVPSAAAAVKRPVLELTGSGGGEYYSMILRATSSPRATCRARMSASGRRDRLPGVRSGKTGSTEWSFSVGKRAPRGRYTATVTCLKSGRSAVSRIRLRVPGASVRRPRLVLRSVTARPSDVIVTTKGAGLGAGGRNPYPAYQCTWYAWSKRPDLPWFAGDSGNARNWATSARRRGIPTGRTPVAGAIAVFAPGQYWAGGWGHVAYVESVSGGRMTISEYNLGRPLSGPSRRTIGWSGLEFIYGGPSGNPNVPAQSAPAPVPAASVRIIDLVHGQTLTGVRTLTAEAANASAVRFDAYYATTPGNILSVGWHTLGVAGSAGGGRYSLAVDTRTIPDQGDEGWGTVNIAAIPVTADGTPQAARDYRRINIDNRPAPSTAVIDFTNPSANPARVGGTITLRAYLPGVSGVAFSAYYASNPADITSVAWRPLGTGAHIGGGVWTMALDTRSIPTQGNVGWGTVNFAAIVTGGSGQLTEQRYYVRTDVAN